MKKIIKNPFVWAFFLGIVFLHFYREYSLLRKGAPEPLVKVKDWQLLNEEGNILSKSDLKGKVIVADFFFTKCPSICPMLTNSMKEIYDKLIKKQENLVFLSITVDPKNDTPFVLKEFKNKNNILKSNWHFLTGSKKDIYDTVVEKMAVHVGEREDLGQGFYDIPHLAQLVLFDQNGDLRGLFETSPKGKLSLIRAANFLIDSFNENQVLP